MIDEDEFWRSFNAPVRSLSELPAGLRLRILDGIRFEYKTGFSQCFSFIYYFFIISTMHVKQIVIYDWCCL